jgi:hypothetical protein
MVNCLQPFEVPYGKGLIKKRRRLSAVGTEKSGTVAERLGRFKGVATARTERPGDCVEIIPAGRAKMGDTGCTDR